MKTMSLILTTLILGVTGLAHANVITVKNSQQSVGPLSVTYSLAYQNAAHAVHFGPNQKVELQPGQSLKSQKADGLLIRKLNFVTGAGRTLSKSFSATSYGKEQSCSLAQSGDLKLWLGKHRLTCQHSNA